MIILFLGLISVRLISDVKRWSLRSQELSQLLIWCFRYLVIKFYYLHFLKIENTWHICMSAACTNQINLGKNICIFQNLPGFIRENEPRWGTLRRIFWYWGARHYPISCINGSSRCHGLKGIIYASKSQALCAYKIYLLLCHCQLFLSSVR